jgi:LysR family transcriptional regulator, nitrogen assimilation regulatory protein
LAAEESGVGYSLLPLSAFARDTSAGRLRYAPIHNPRVTRQLVPATQPGARKSRAAQKLAVMIRQEIVSLVGGEHWNANLMFTPDAAARRA